MTIRSRSPPRSQGWWPSCEDVPIPYIRREGVGGGGRGKCREASSTAQSAGRQSCCPLMDRATTTATTTITIRPDPTGGTIKWMIRAFICLSFERSALGALRGEEGGEKQEEQEEEAGEGEGVNTGAFCAHIGFTEPDVVVQYTTAKPPALVHHGWAHRTSASRLCDWPYVAFLILVTSSERQTRIAV